MKDPLKKSYHHIALGSETFIKKIEEKVEHKGGRREIPSTRFLSKYDVNTVITKMTQVLHIEKRMRYFIKKEETLIVL